MASMLDRNRGRVDAVKNATLDSTTLLAGSPVMVKADRVNGSDVKACIAHGDLPAPNALAQFAGVVLHDLEVGDDIQNDAGLQVEGICKALVKIPASGSDVVLGAHLLPASDCTNHYFTPTAMNTGIVLLEDLTAETDGTIVQGLVEILPGAAWRFGPRMFVWIDAALGSTTYYEGAVAGTTGVQTITDFSSWSKVKPDYPRNIVITPGGTTADVAAMSITVAGKDCDGGAITEDFAFAANAATATTGNKAFAEITSVTIPAQDGAGATFDFGTGAKLGIGRCFEGTPAMIKARAAGSNEATAPTIAYDRDDVESNTISFNTALDGSKDCDVVLWG